MIRRRVLSSVASQQQQQSSLITTHCRTVVTATHVRLDDNNNNGDKNNSTPPIDAEEQRIPPSWRHGHLAQPRRDRRVDPAAEALRDQFKISHRDYNKDVDGPRDIHHSDRVRGELEMGGRPGVSADEIDLKTGRRKPSSSSGSPPRRPPSSSNDDQRHLGDLDGHENISHFGSSSSSSTSINRSNSKEGDLPAHNLNYGSGYTTGDEQFFSTSPTSVDSLRNFAVRNTTDAAAAAGYQTGRGESRSAQSRAGYASGAHTNRVGDARSKFQQYATRGYDWLEKIAKKGPHQNDRDLKNSVIILAFALLCCLAFIYWMIAYKTIVLTTNANRKEVTRLPRLPTDFVYMQTKWPWSLFTFPWSAPNKSLLVVEEIAPSFGGRNGKMTTDPNFPMASGNIKSVSNSGKEETVSAGSSAATTADVVAGNGNDNSDDKNSKKNLSVAVNPLFISTRLYRCPRDYVIQIHPDAVTGRNTEHRVWYNRLFYKAIPFLFERELPYLVLLQPFADPTFFQKELRTENQFEAIDTLSPAGLPDYYPATKKPAVPNQKSNNNDVTTLNPHPTSEAAAAQKAPKLLLNLRLRFMADFPTNVGAGPFVENVIDESAKAVFQKYYYEAILRHHSKVKYSTDGKNVSEAEKQAAAEAEQNFIDNKNSAFVQRMIATGVINGHGVTFEDIFAGVRGEQFVTEVLNEVVLRVRENAIIIEKSGTLV